MVHSIVFHELSIFVILVFHNYIESPTFIMHDLSSGRCCTDLGTMVSDTRVPAHTFMHTRD